jgi:hypothetical protein
VHENVRARSQRLCCECQLANAPAGSSRVSASASNKLPVMDSEGLIGVVSIGDLVKDILSEQKFIIEQLEHYITGQRG